jgi:hypothetical protein
VEPALPVPQNKLGVFETYKFTSPYIQIQKIWKDELEFVCILNACWSVCSSKIPNMSLKLAALGNPVPTFYCCFFFPHPNP